MPSRLPGLGFHWRDIARAALFAALMFSLLPASRWWMPTLWAFCWVGATIAFSRLGDRVHDSLGLTLLGMALALALILWPLAVIGIAVLSAAR
jgi:hypothetical protein